MIEIVLGTIFGVCAISISVGIFLYIEKKRNAKEIAEFKKQKLQVEDTRIWVENYKLEKRAK